MALFETHSDANRLPGGRVVIYSSEPYVYDGDGLAPKAIYWKCRRDSSARFEYLGMTESAANACRDALRQKYTRSYMRQHVSLVDNRPAGWSTVIGYPHVRVTPANVVECGAGIEPSPVAGDDWKVTVDVREVDEAISLVPLETVEEFKALFQEAELRDGMDSDDPDAGIAVASAHWLPAENKIRVTFTHTIKSYNPLYLAVQVLSGGAWVAATGASVSGSVVTFDATKNETLRLVYGATGVTPIYSREYTTVDEVHVPLEIDSAEIRLVGRSAGIGHDPYLSLDVACAESLLASADSYWVKVTVGGREIQFRTYRIDDLGFDPERERYVYRFQLSGSMPTIPLPWEATVEIGPLRDARLDPSAPFSFTFGTDFSLVSASIESIAAGKANVKLVLSSSLGLAALAAGDVAWSTVSGPSEEITHPTFTVTAASGQEDAYEIAFEANYYPAAATKADGRVVFSATDPETGTLLSTGVNSLFYPARTED